jgi:Flp pilus assembly pilin Flp
MSTRSTFRRELVMWLTALKAMPAKMRGLVDGEGGQDLMEYGMLMALIAVVAMAGVSFLGQQVDSVMWQMIANNF